MRPSAWIVGVGVALVAFVALSMGGCDQRPGSQPIEDVAGLEVVSFDIGGMT